MIALALPVMLMLAPAARAPAPAMELDGVWQSACAPIGKNGRHGYIVTVRIAHGRFDGRADLYATPACASPTLRVDFRAARLDLRAVGDHTDLALTVRSVRLTPLRQDVVGKVDVDPAAADVEHDLVAGLHSCERATGRGLGRDVEDDGPEGRATHPRVGNPDHVANAFLEEPLGHRQHSPLGEARSAERTGVSYEELLQRILNLALSYKAHWMMSY